MMQRRGVQLLVALGLFALLTAAMTWPQALYLSSRATPHHDVYFNMWRLRWFAHALVTPAFPSQSCCDESWPRPSLTSSQTPMGRCQRIAS